MDPTECNLDEEGKPHCSVCGGRAFESSRHLSHFDFATGTPLLVERVFGQCRKCNASRWWRTEPHAPRADRRRPR
jgi:hypothetical protein